MRISPRTRNSKLIVIRMGISTDPKTQIHGKAASCGGDFGEGEQEEVMWSKSSSSRLSTEVVKKNTHIYTCTQTLAF